MNAKTNKLWDRIVNAGIASEDTLRVITAINGYSVETLNDVIYAVTGLRNWKQYKAEYADFESFETIER